MAELTKITTAQISDYESGSGGSELDASKAYKLQYYDNLSTLVPNSAGDICVVALRISGNTGKASRAGGGTFLAVSGTATEDGGTIVQSTGFYWQRVGYTKITPQMFGAVVNGSTDDGAAIRAALAVAVDKAMVLHLPSGNYRMTSGTLTISNNDVVIEGDGIGKTYLYTDSTLTAVTISPAINNTSIRGISFQSVGATRTSGTRAVYANGGNLSTGSIGFINLQDCSVVGYYDAVNFQYCQLGKVHGCTFESCRNGYYSKLCVNMRVFGNKVNNNTGVGVYLDGDSGSVNFSAGTLMSNNEIVNNGSAGTPQVQIVYNEHFTLSNNMIDVPLSGSTYNVHVIGSARGTISSNWIGSSISQALRVESTQALMVQGNNIISSGAEGVVNLGNSTNNVYNGNVFEANTSTDILLGGTGTGSVISNNICVSTTPTNSIAETSASLSNLIVGNAYKKGFVTGGSSTVSANKVI